MYGNVALKIMKNRVHIYILNFQNRVCILMANKIYINMRNRVIAVILIVIKKYKQIISAVHNQCLRTLFRIFLHLKVGKF